MNEKQQSLVPAESKDAAIVPSEPARLLEIAVKQGADVDTLERLTALWERFEERKSEAALVKALNEFQSRCSPILKRNKVNIDKGPQYSFASLTNIKVAIRPLLDELGLSVSFSVTDDEKRVTCTVRHRDGASEISQFPIRLDGKMRVNDTQRMASAVTYARRYALTGALGIDTTDDDGLAAGEPPQHENPQHDASAPKTQPRDKRVTRKDLGLLLADYETYNPIDNNKFAEWASSVTGIEVKDVMIVSSWTPMMLTKCMERAAIERGGEPNVV